jgi:RHS repeat-associated protein
MINQYKRLATSIYLMCGIITLSAQTKGKNLVISTPVTTTQNYVARESIAEQNGFSFIATATSSLTAMIDPTILLTPTENTYAKPDGTITTDKTQGGIVGSIDGSFTVSPSGSANYSIPISCPSGINGMQPHVSLNYNSQASNGIAGWGWSLSAMSAISRCGSDLHHDRKVVGTQLTTDDNLMLDGQRLVLVLGNNLTEGAKYRTVNESYSDITFKKINGVLCFEVVTKDGTTMEFGSSTLSNFKGQGTETINWLLTKVTDRNGNYMVYEYGVSSTKDEFWLDNIKYTYNAAAGITTASSQIKFNYTTARFDGQTSYIAGQRIIQTHLLTSIQTSTNSEIQREYSLSYTPDDFYNKLTAVTETGLDGVRYNPTVINWKKLNSTTTPAFGHTISTTTLSNVPQFRYDPTTVFLDVNNDGIQDIIKPTNQMALNPDKTSSLIYTGWEVYKSNGSTYTFNQSETISSNPYPQYNLIPVDLNNDGVKDLLEIKGLPGNPNRFASSGSYILNALFVNSQTGMLTRQNLNIELTCKYNQQLAFELGDYNADGVVELLVKTITFYDTSGSVSLYTIDIANKKLTQIGADTPMSDLSLSSTTDFNGNGIPEIITGGHCQIYEYSTSLQKFSPITFTHSLGIMPDLSELAFGDFNGDGKTDVLQYLGTTWSILISTGNKFETIACPITRQKNPRPNDTDPRDTYIITDLNGDGKGDIVEVDVVKKIGCFYYYNGSKFIKSTDIDNTASTYIDPRTMYYDLTGDGKGDLINIREGSNYDVNINVTSFSTTETERAVSSITNGMGMKNTVIYQPLSAAGVYTNGTSTPAYPVVKVCIPVSVVTQTTKTAGTCYETCNYTYGGLWLHTRGLGVMGFETFTVDDVTQNQKLTNTFSFNPTHFNSFITEKLLTTSAGSPIRKVKYVNDYVNLELNYNHHIYPYVSSQLTTDYLTGLVTETKTSNLDLWGNAQTIVTTKGVSAATKIVETATGTYVQAGSWCPNKIKTAITTKVVNGQTYTRKSQFTFDNKGNLLSDYIDSTDVNAVKTTHGNYDLFGHERLITKITNGISRSTSSTYTPSGRFLFSKTNSLGESTQYAWDETKGWMLSETNRIGTTYYTYNEFGALNSTEYPDHTKKAQVAQWATPNNAIGAQFYIYSESSGSSPALVWYNAGGQEIVKEHYGLNDKKISVSTRYYTDGRIYSVSNPYFDEDASNKTWASIYTYDTYGRPKTVTTPSGVTTSAYNGTTNTVTSPDGTNEVTINDAGQTIISKVNGKAVNYTYYPSGNVKTSTPEGGKAVTYEYNLQGQRTKIIDPDGGTEETKYNGFGEVTETKQKVHNATTDVTTTKNYYPNGLPISSVCNGETTSYTYDIYNRQRTIEIAGKNKKTFTYDAFDRITNVQEEIGNRIYNTAKEYDLFGRVKKEIFPSGIYTINLYDSNGNLVEIKDNADRSIWKANAENARRQLTSINKGSKETTFGYDSRGLPTSIIASGVENMSYVFDTKGNLQSRTDNMTSQEERMQYDGMNRLTNWDIYQNNLLAKKYSITFDNTYGNIAAKSDLASAKGPSQLAYGGTRGDGTAIGPHALTSISQTPDNFPTTDLNITYTDFKKVATMTEGNKYYELTYGVDAERRKSEYKVGGVTQLTRYYLHCYEEEINSLGNVRKIHYLPCGAMLIQNNGMDSLLYGYSDYQGSLVALTDEGGNVIEKYAYDPWGARRNADDWTTKDARTKWITNRGYTGHEHLDAFGVINMNGRVYDPATGMFLSPDPYIQAPQDWLNYNRYSYCMGNPFKYTDPSGKLIWTILETAFGAVAGVIASPFVFVRDLCEGKSFKQACNDAWGAIKNSIIYGFNIGQGFDRECFGDWTQIKNWKWGNNKDGSGTDDGTDITSGTTGSSTTPVLQTSTKGDTRGDKYYEFDDLSSAVAYMNSVPDIETSCYVLQEPGVNGKIHYYVLDWSTNTSKDSNQRYYESYDPEDKRKKFNGMYITAQLHTHPEAGFTISSSNHYDGPSEKDYKLACELGIPVYSIGPSSVCMVRPNDTRWITGTTEYADKRYKLENGKITNSFVDAYGNYDGQSTFFYKATVDWMKNPDIPLLNTR